MRRTGCGAAALLVAAAGLCGCAPWPSRATTLQLGICGLVSGGHGDKESFIRQFGVPTACRALASGEACEWTSEPGAGASDFSDEMRVEFDASGRFVSGSAQVRRGSRTYGHAGPDDKCRGMKSAAAAPRPPGPDIQTLYERMRQAYAQDPGRAAALWRRLSFMGRGQLESYVVSAKGRGGTLTWKYRVDAGLPADEQDFVTWFLRSFTQYLPVKD
ncbi:MAG: hypothetical protein PHU21_09785 [Elusimicrobia bacterium]|nr:hypothetical protein [Elusimicrobiota bacterium]